MQREVLMEQFFTALISGNRSDSRAVIDQLIDSDCEADKIINRLVWPTLEQIQNLYRNDQMTEMAHHFATRLLRSTVDQLQIRLVQQERREQTALVMCGPEESEELAAQIVADLLEADGYDVYYIGGGVANDEIVAQLNEMQADKLVVFGAVPSTVPSTRLLIDHLHEIGACEQTQVIVGGGVFNRAEGLAEEIGADLWANTPEELVEEMAENPDRRMSEDQRTVGRKRRAKAA